MRHTTSRSIVATLVVVTAFGASTAQAKTPHKYSSVIQTAQLSTANGYPGTGGTVVLAGSWNTPQFGDGAVVDHATITGQSGSTISFRGTEVGFLPLGSVKSKFTGTSEVQPDGSQKLTTTGRFIGGTGAYKGAKGKYKFTGSTAPGGSVVTGRSTGAISY